MNAAGPGRSSEMASHSCGRPPCSASNFLIARANPHPLAHDPLTREFGRRNRWGPGFHSPAGAPLQCRSLLIQLPAGVKPPPRPARRQAGARAVFDQRMTFQGEQWAPGPVGRMQPSGPSTRPSRKWPKRSSRAAGNCSICWGPRSAAGLARAQPGCVTLRINFQTPRARRLPFSSCPTTPKRTMSVALASQLSEGHQEAPTMPRTTASYCSSRVWSIKRQLTGKLVADLYFVVLRHGGGKIGNSRASGLWADRQRTALNAFARPLRADLNFISGSDWRSTVSATLRGPGYVAGCIRLPRGDIPSLLVGHHYTLLHRRSSGGVILQEHCPEGV